MEKVFFSYCPMVETEGGMLTGFFTFESTEGALNITVIKFLGDYKKE